MTTKDKGRNKWNKNKLKWRGKIRAKSWYLEKSYKFDKSLTKLIKKKRKSRYKCQEWGRHPYILYKH